MADSFKGADLDALRALAKQLDNGANKLNDLESQVTKRVNGVTWDGSDRKKFISGELAQVKKTARSAGTEMTKLAKVLRAQASEQETVSIQGGALTGGTDKSGNKMKVKITDKDWTLAESKPDKKWGKHFGAEEEEKDDAEGKRNKPKVNATLYEDSAKADVAWKEYKAKGSTTGGYGTLEGQAGVSFLAAGASANYGLSVGTDGLTAKAGANASANLIEGEASGSWKKGPVGVNGAVRGNVGVDGNADASVNLGKDGGAATAGVGAFAGAKVTGTLGADIAGVKPKVSATGSAGLGAHAKVDGKIGVDKIKVSADVGATLGLGGSVKFDIEVDPGEVAKNVGSAFKGLNPFK